MDVIDCEEEGLDGLIIGIASSFLLAMTIGIRLVFVGCFCILQLRK